MAETAEIAPISSVIADGTTFVREFNLREQLAATPEVFKMVIEQAAHGYWLNCGDHITFDAAKPDAHTIRVTVEYITATEPKTKSKSEPKA